MNEEKAIYLDQNQKMAQELTEIQKLLNKVMGGMAM